MNIEKQIFLPFTRLKSRNVTAVFDEPLVSSDGGVLLLREVMSETGIIEKLSHAVGDTRHQGDVDHTLPELLAQRVCQICCGYEDANDSDKLREDPTKPPILFICTDRPLSPPFSLRKTTTV